MKHIYCISGFGADERVFANLDFGKNEVHFIQWKIPEKNETIASYAQRMRQDILHPNPVLVGLSFGGMMCIEIAKIISVEKIIMISSMKTYNEKPLYMKLAAKLRLNKIIHIRPSRFFEPLENWHLSATTKEEKKLLRSYRNHINKQYADWAIDTILHWKNDWYPPSLVHLHGSKDRILPIRNIKADYVISQGGHLMLLDRAKEVNEILRKLLQ